MVADDKGFVNRDQTDALIYLANNEQESLYNRIEAAKHLLERAETKLAHVNHQVDMWRNKWLDLTAQKVQQRNAKEMQDTVTEALKGMSESELLAKLQSMIDRRRDG